MFESVKRGYFPGFLGQCIPEFSSLETERVISILCTSNSWDIKKVCVSKIVVGCFKSDKMLSIDRGFSINDFKSFESEASQTG